MEPNLFKYIWQHSRRDQIVILFVVLCSLPFYFMSLDLPKVIVNNAIQGKAFQGHSTIKAFDFSFSLPSFLGGATINVFEGLEVERLGYLLGLSIILFLLVIINGAFKYQINIAKGLIGERMLRRMRFDLFRQLLIFRPEEARLIKPSEAASIIKDEVEPIGGFIGDAFIQPAFLSTQALTALFFIMYQHLWLGLLTVLTIVIQAVIIPILRKKQLLLGKERQIASRQLAGKIGELVDGMNAVRGHGTTTYESAEISGRLGNLFRIRFELFKRKFAVKYLNNLLAQLTPFLYYTVGGYFALKGSLDVGQLVAVIAAYKDIPPPVKELIDWDQQRNDVTIKYEQVVEQFSPVPQNFEPPRPNVLTLGTSGPLVVENLTVGDGRGTTHLEGATVNIPLPAHVALVGTSDSGRDIFSRALARQITKYDGEIRVGDARLATLNPADLSSILAYAGPDPALFPGSIRENIAYGLRRRIPPLNEDGIEPPELARRRESLRTGNLAERADDDWYDYSLAGIDSQETLDIAIAEVLKVVGLIDDIYRFGMGARIDPTRDHDLAERLVEARHRIRAYLIEKDMTRMIEPFDPDAYNTNGTIGENLLFGAMTVEGVAPMTLFANETVRDILRAEGLAQTLGDIGAGIAETMLEIFAGLAPGHALFERFSFINAAELPEFESIVARWRQLAAKPDTLDSGFSRLAALALHYIEPRHRLGLLNDERRGQIVAARAKLNAFWSQQPKPPVEHYHPDRYCVSAPIRDNLLFGRVGFGVAGATDETNTLLRDTVSEFALEGEIFRIGLNYQVGPAGRLLFGNQRNAIEVARCLIRRPQILIVDGALAGYRSKDAADLIQRMRLVSEGRTLLVDMPEGQTPQGFDMVITFDNGRISGVEVAQEEKEAAQ